MTTTEPVETIEVADPDMERALAKAGILERDGWTVSGATRCGAELWLVTVTREGRQAADSPVRSIAEQAEALGLTQVAAEPDVIWSGVVNPRA